MAQVNHNTLQIGDIVLSRDAEGNVTLTSQSKTTTLYINAADFAAILTDFPSMKTDGTAPRLNPDGTPAPALRPITGPVPYVEKQRSSQDDKTEAARVAEAKRVADERRRSGQEDTSEVQRVAEAKRVVDEKNAAEVKRSSHKPGR